MAASKAVSSVNDSVYMTDKMMADTTVCKRAEKKAGLME